ncbi:MAG: hypothetical protein LAO07_11570 [Acidobacteriia bacterium]|nr:hypothetical protein [Terriglobia bacterium]
MIAAILFTVSIVALVQDQRLLAWALVGLFVLSLVVGFYPVAASWAGACMQRRGDEIIARREFPELRKLVEQFGEFIDRGRGDNLHYVVQSDVYGGYSDRFNTLGLPNINLFQSLWCNLTERAANQKPTPTDLKTTSSELSTLVSLYNNYCMNQVFEQLPQELRTQLSDRSKSNLEACRERFVAFLNDYSKYLKHFDEPFAARYLQTRDFPRPRPL